MFSLVAVNLEHKLASEYRHLHLHLPAAVAAVHDVIDENASQWRAGTSATSRHQVLVSLVVRRNGLPVKVTVQHQFPVR